MKKFLKISAAAAAAGLSLIFAGCGGCAGCSNTTNATVTNSNWYTGTSYKGIQPSFITDENHPEYTPEEIIYDVTFDNSSAKNSSYSVAYENGTFTTLFYATHYNWNNSLEGYKSDKSELVYCYRTQLNISVTYTLKDGTQSEKFDDSVISECYFRSAGKSLQPVYSEQTINSTSPNKSKAKKLEDAYKQINVTYKSYYSPDCTEVTCVTKEGDNAETSKTHNFKKVKNTLFDNSSLYIAMRSMKVSAAQSISLFSGAAGGASTYAVTPQNTELEIGEHKAISAALDKAGLYTIKTEDSEGNPIEDAGIKTQAMSVNYAGGNLVGTTQTVWYAAVENPDNNTARATMLKISVPLSYNLGTLNYTLKEVKTTLWS